MSKKMENSNKIKSLWVAITILILINLSILWYLWFTTNPQQDQASPIRIEQSLHFDDGQKAQFEIIKNKHFSEVIIIRDSIKIIKAELFDYLKQDNLDQKYIDKKVELLANKIKENESKTLKHFTEIRAMCNKEQKQIFDNDILERFKRQRPNGGRGRPEMDGRPPRLHNSPPH